MFKTVLLALALSLPHLHGLATWYDPCAHHGAGGWHDACARRDHPMRDGRPFRYDAPTVAVDASHWPEWEGAVAVILTECGQLRFARVTDTGKLYAAGWFRWGVDGLGTLRYWPTTTANIKWLKQGCHRVVADFPRDYYRARVACQRDAQGGVETTVVRMWIIVK